jgi:hypothetical protein
MDALNQSMHSVESVLNPMDSASVSYHDTRGPGLTPPPSLRGSGSDEGVRR